ncbi:MAG TPA: serine hydrolase, partial [Accumulibacter sp.]|nr:serine hydrolase [Accumulibacter sp.]
MRSKIRMALILGALISAGLLPPSGAQAADKHPGKAGSHKSKSAAVAQKATGQKFSAAKIVARNSSGTVTHGQGKPVGKHLVHASKTESVVKYAKAAPSKKARNVGKLAKGETARHARAAEIVRTSVEVRQPIATQRKNLSKALANNLDIWQEPGPLAVQSGSALVISQDSGEAIYEKNAHAVLPIASITKLMTAMVVLDSMPNLQAPISISEDDVDYLRGSRSRLSVGSVIARETALLLALMSSENRAANALARHYPGGLPAFIAAMNRKAASLGMTQTHFDDPTGLNSTNVSTAHDLARMVAAAHRYPLIREFSTTPGTRAEISGRELEFHNTNQLVHSPSWVIG